MSSQYVCYECINGRNKPKKCMHGYMWQQERCNERREEFYRIQLKEDSMDPREEVKELARLMWASWGGSSPDVSWESMDEPYRFKWLAQAEIIIDNGDSLIKCECPWDEICDCGFNHTLNSTSPPAKVLEISKEERIIMYKDVRWMIKNEDAFGIVDYFLAKLSTPQTKALDYHNLDFEITKVFQELRVLHDVPEPILEDLESLIKAKLSTPQAKVRKDL